MLKKITENVYYMDYKDSNRPVLGLVIGNNSSLMIDGGASKEHFEEFKALISKMDIPSLKYLVLTHSHENHMLGARGANLINVINGMTNEKLKNKSYIDSELFNADIIYDEFLKIDLGNIVVELERIPSDHTRDCSIVHIPSAKTVFLGDALYSNKKHEKLCYTHELMIPLLKELQCYEADYYIPSHSEAFSSEDFIAYSKKIIAISKATKGIYDLEIAKEKVKSILNIEIDDSVEVIISAFLNGEKENNN
ncbi:MAG: MBL fold metallo-hydrolase [Sarcina sp.]